MRSGTANSSRPAIWPLGLTNASPRVAMMLIACLVAGTLATTLVVAQAPLAARATTPGSPNFPQPGSSVYTETFENQSPTTPGSVMTYTGGTAALGQTYTADPQYRISGNTCDGLIFNATTTISQVNGDTCFAGGNGPIFLKRLEAISQAQGLYQGQSASAAVNNTALAELTGSASPIFVGILIQTNSSTIPAVAGHFYNISALIGAVAYGPNTGTGCGTIPGNPNNDPLLTFSLLDGAMKFHSPLV